MCKILQGSISRLIVPLLILALACSFSPSLPSIQPGSGYRYDDLPSQGRQDSAIAEYQAISKWGTLEIRYFFANGTDKLEGNTEWELIRQAFGLWAAQTPLRFLEAAGQQDANIVIAWASGEHGDGDPFDGPGDVLAHASFPSPYDDRQVFLHFDDDERWVNSTTRNVDLLTVAAHEIGHTLGLAHSEDPGALMYPSYDGPRRSLGADDIAGIQDLYGLSSNPAPAPDAPGNETPPSSDGQDGDQDGLADQDEILITGTDPNNPDHDGDGLTDGIEVQNRMNPLDPDMDRDGISDGQEVAQGSDPLFPEQSDLPPELEQGVADFLTQAIELEIESYRSGSAEPATAVMDGEALSGLQENIAALNQQGLVMIAEIDYYQSYINDIRPAGSRALAVDTCEVWTNTTYQAADGQPVQSEGPALVPQTITIQEQGGGWFITSVQFYDPPASCNW